jgi:hypothetical protein
MRLLQYDSGNHHKNQHGIEIMTRSLNISYVKSRDPSVCAEEWDIVFIPSGYISPDRFPSAKKIIYGPHNYEFEGIWPTLQLTHMPNVYFNILSEWNKKRANEMSDFDRHIKMACLPFAVDVDAFCPPINKQIKRDCFIYFKHRDPSHLQTAITLCNSLGLTYEIIQYGSYSEKTYKDILDTSKFGIWIGSHESQGFAVEEALSKNIPLVVWDVESLFDEIIDGHKPWGKFEGMYTLRASVIPYWDERCGIVASVDTLRESIERMMNTYQQFQPRAYILETLTPEICMKRWIDL